MPLDEIAQVRVESASRRSLKFRIVHADASELALRVFRRGRAHGDEVVELLSALVVARSPADDADR